MLPGTDQSKLAIELVTWLARYLSGDDSDSDYYIPQEDNEANPYGERSV